MEGPLANAIAISQVALAFLVALVVGVAMFGSTVTLYVVLGAPVVMMAISGYEAFARLPNEMLADGARLAFAGALCAGGLLFFTGIFMPMYRFIYDLLPDVLRVGLFTAFL